LPAVFLAACFRWKNDKTHNKSSMRKGQRELKRRADFTVRQTDYNSLELKKQIFQTFVLEIFLARLKRFEKIKIFSKSCLTEKKARLY